MLFEEYLVSPTCAGANLSDRHKVSLALANMDRSSAPWRDSQLRKYQTVTTAHPTGQWPTWDDFKTTFKSKWGDRNEAAKAFRNLQNYRYDPRRGDDLQTTLTKVDTWILDAGITSDEQKKTFL